MKRFFFLSALFAIVLSAQAQPRQGHFSVIPRIGVNFANITNNEVVVDLSQQSNTLKSRVKPGLLASVDVEYQATDLLFASLGLQYSMQDELMEGFSDWHTNLGYLNVPLLVGCRITDGFSVKAGVQLGMLLNAKNYMSTTDIIPQEGGGREQGKAVEQTTDLYDSCKKVDISIPLAVSYEFENVILDARYNIGLSRIYDLDLLKSRNSVIQLTVGYRFQL